jgi:hypothetical protein
MAVEYTLICNTCKEFIRLYKLRLFDGPSHPLPMLGIPVQTVAVINALKKFRNGFPGKMPEWINDLEPFINTFLIDHAQHELVMKDDYSDPLWYPESPGYAVWKERQTPSSNELFLPRNLVDDLHIADWEEAEHYLKLLHVMLYEDLELNEYKHTFDELIKNNYLR